MFEINITKNTSTTFDKERAQSVFIIANNTNADIVLFGQGVSTNPNSMQIIMEEKKASCGIMPHCIHWWDLIINNVE